MPVQVAEAVRFIANAGEIFGQSQLGELTHSGRLQMDADTERGGLADGLVNASCDAGLVQA
jgi:hypothetical protein